MKALLVIDVQNAIVEMKDFQQELSLMETVIRDFNEQTQPVIFIQHFDEQEESPLHRSSTGSHIHKSLVMHADTIVEKHTPSSFFQTELAHTLEMLGVTHLVIVGFETEFCCLFTAIAAFDRGYQVTLIQDAIGTGNSAEIYQMPGLDINKFVGNVLQWSSVIEVMNYREYVEKYGIDQT